MIGLRIDQAKGLFFDRAAVQSAVDKSTRKVLSKFGAFVRTRAKSSIRAASKSKPTSSPGEPPRSHTGLLKKFIFFVFDPDSRSVVIGPTRLNQAIGDAPAALEHGGPSKVLVRRKGKRTVRPITVRQRPYMGPAFAAELPKADAMWRDSVK